MPSNIEVTPELTEKVAALARIELSPEERIKITKQISEVLNYVATLSDVNVEGIEPMTHPLSVELPLRDDTVRPFESGEKGPKVLESAPEVLYDGYKVPSII